MTREDFCGEFSTARFAAGVVLAVIAAVLVLPALVACDSPLPAYEAECDFYDITLDYDGERTVTLKETVITKTARATPWKAWLFTSIRTPFRSKPKLRRTLPQTKRSSSPTGKVLAKSRF